MILTGCIGGESQETINPEKKTNQEGFTVYDLKKKYGTESKKSIMPMYNVAYDKQFAFEFKSDLGGISPYEIISVHTDIKVKEESKLLTFPSLEAKSDGSILTIKPGPVAVLASNETSKGVEGWGNAPIYYIRINYDLDAETPTKLDEPIIVPFTVKSDLPVPNLRYEISVDGRLKLVWDPVEGAKEYKVYNVRRIKLLETTNIPISGPEKGYVGDTPSLVATVTGTEFDDFMQDGTGALLVSGDGSLVSEQNRMVNGEYYVTAVNGDAESNFSAPVNTIKLSKQLPFEYSDEDDIAFATYEHVDQLPKKLKIEFIDGSISEREVIYDATNVKIEEFGNSILHYQVKGTALKGYVFLSKVTEQDLEKLKNSSTNDATGNVEVTNEVDYVPDPEVPTIIDVPDAPESNDSSNQEEVPATEGTPAPEEGNDEQSNTDSVVQEQKENTEKLVEDGNKAPLPTTPKDVKLNVSSAFEEYLAINMINAEERISLKAFPEAQNSEVLVDTLRKVLYQNPMILSLEKYGYDYRSLELILMYNDTKENIQKKQQEIIAEANKIISTIIKDGMSDEEKRNAIYTYLNDHTKYDDGALKSAEENNFKEVDPKFNDSFTTYGIMVKKVGVCMSYAYTYKMLADLAGVESIVVTGKANGVPHAWNKVKIDNEWLHVDATNNETNSGIPYLMYNSNDEQAEKINSITDSEYWLDQEIGLFVGKTNANDYYVQNGLEIKTIEEYKTKLTPFLKEGKEIIVFRLADGLDQQELLEAAVTVIKEHVPDKLETAKMSEFGNYIIILP